MVRMFHVCRFVCFIATCIRWRKSAKEGEVLRRLCGVP